MEENKKNRTPLSDQNILQHLWQLGADDDNSEEPLASPENKPRYDLDKASKEALQLLQSNEYKAAAEKLRFNVKLRKQHETDSTPPLNYNYDLGIDLINLATAEKNLGNKEAEKITLEEALENFNLDAIQLMQKNQFNHAKALFEFIVAQRKYLAVESTSPMPSSHYHQLALAQLNLGRVAKGLQQLELAEAVFHKAFENFNFAESTAQGIEKIRIERDKATCLKQLHEFTLQLAGNSDGSNINDSKNYKIKNKQGIKQAKSKINLGEEHLNNKRYAEALAYFFEAKKLLTNDSVAEQEVYKKLFDLIEQTFAATADRFALINQLAEILEKKAQLLQGQGKLIEANILLDEALKQLSFYQIVTNPLLQPVKKIQKKHLQLPLLTGKILSRKSEILYLQAKILITSPEEALGYFRASKSAAHEALLLCPKHPTLRDSLKVIKAHIFDLEVTLNMKPEAKDKNTGVFPIRSASPTIHPERESKYSMVPPPKIGFSFSSTFKFDPSVNEKTSLLTTPPNYGSYER